MLGTQVDRCDVKPPSLGRMKRCGFLEVCVCYTHGANAAIGDGHTNAPGWGGGGRSLGRGLALPSAKKRLVPNRGISLLLRRLEAALIFSAHHSRWQRLSWRASPKKSSICSTGVGEARAGTPLAIVIFAVVASAPFSVTDALAIMNGALFGPLVGSLVNAGGIVLAAVLGYAVALRTSKLLDIEATVRRLPGSGSAISRSARRCS